MAFRSTPTRATMMWRPRKTASAASLPFNTPPATSCAPAWEPAGLSRRAP
jgi:hypothetical protein